MNLERMKQVVQENAKDHDKFAIVMTDGDYEYARTKDEALTVLEQSMSMRESLEPMRHDYGIVRIED